MKVYHSLNKNDCLTDLKTSKDGLTSKEAQKRLEKYGKNELVEAKRKSLVRRFFEQLKDMMIIVLIVAAVISAVLAIVEKKYVDLVDSGIILLIVIINAIIGLVQEEKANNALEALKNINKPFVKVLRDGEVCKIKSEELVVGDIVVLEAGDVVPADLRLIDSASLKIEEATLTGESVPSEKDHNCTLKEETPLGDRKNMAYSSSIVSYGRGTGVVVATGMNTEVGKIANMLKEEKNTQTPLQGQLAKTAKILSIIVLGIAAIIFVASFFNETTGSVASKISKSFMTAVAIAVAAIPEGLPAVVTIVLAIGVKRMSEKNAIVKNLPAVETLGCCEVICSDKTGTITLNKMTVKQLFTPSNGLYYKEDLNHNDYSAKELVSGLTLCNDTIENQDKLVGDPTETALTAYAKKLGISIKELKVNRPRINEIPFDSKRKLMTTVHQMVNGTLRSYTKGAFDVLLNKCTKILDNTTVREITEDDKNIIKQANKNMASDALRVLALAYKENSPENEYEQDLVFIGLVGMIDPPRKEVIKAVQTCKKAGMKAIMITGDHIDTAVAIAKQIGIYSDDDLCITGAELDKLSQKEFMKNLTKYKVYARVSPENKVRIVEAYKSINVIVAMTGDGVNDAPSIKTADIGIGMGITGTDVSKGAADMILTDDNFATIIVAVEEGRKVYSNIQKAVQYLLSANIAEVLCLFIATIFLGVDLLSAVMILWINLVTDSFPALSLGVEKAEKSVMDEPPRKNGSSLFAGQTGKNIIVQGIFQTALTMASFCIGNYALSDGISNHNSVAMTMAFITLCLIQLFHSYNTRSNHSIFKSNPFGNKFINFSFLGGLALTLVVVLVPFLQPFFETTSLTLIEWAISVGCAILIIPLVEIQKLFTNLITKRKNKKNIEE